MGLDENESEVSRYGVVSTEKLAVFNRRSNSPGIELIEAEKSEWNWNQFFNSLFYCSYFNWIIINDKVHHQIVLINLVLLCLLISENNKVIFEVDHRCSCISVSISQSEPSCITGVSLLSLIMHMLSMLMLARVQRWCCLSFWDRVQMWRLPWARVLRLWSQRGWGKVQTRLLAWARCGMIARLLWWGWLKELRCNTPMSPGSS